ncbi:MAG TPA: GNAT family N-acetyltransferase [Solirubrobacteraceae bacterium]
MSFVARRTEDVEDWARAAEPLLAAAPDALHVLGTVLAGMRVEAAEARDPSAPARLLAWVEDADGSPVAAAVRNPPHPFVVTNVPAGAAGALASALREGFAGDAPLFAGPSDAARAVAEAWARATGGRPAVVMGQTIHALSSVAPQPAQPSGAVRAAAEADRPLLEEWMGGFGNEVGLPLGDPAAWVGQALGDERIVVWDDGGPACLVRWSPVALGRVRITAVYTPPERRGRGYAQATVAAMACRLLGEVAGLVIVTDDANPTANGVYARVGYRPVSEAAVWTVR